MSKERLHIRQACPPTFYKIKVGRGFSLIEIILACALFLVLAATFVGAFLYGQESMQLAGTRNRAAFLAEESLEATRILRDEQMSNLVDGTYGLTMSGNQWGLVAAPDVTNGFTRQIDISSIDANTKRIRSTVTWQQNLQRQGSLTLDTVLTDWHALSQTQAEGTVIDVSQASLSGDNKELRNITVRNTMNMPLTMTTMTVSWQNSRKIENIRIGTTTIWSKNGPGTPSGTQNSGTLLNIQDYTLESQEDEEIDNIKFSGSMAGQTITIEFGFSDGSNKSVTVF
ncbi:hypothetical protein HY620_02850 [Candidatus Uhrbacteria bacterium]|nr:hypothetical protein [Candidatus Uhrbacteria bacterium]